MRLLRLFTLLLTASLLLSSCDAVRSMLGKPTSEDLEILRQEQEAAKAQARLDSISAVQAEAERLAAEAEAAAHNVSKRYYVAMGGFKVPENAVNYKAYLEAHGYDVLAVRFRTGYDVLLTYGTDNYYEALRKMNDLMENEKTCPYDIWIYDTKTGVHE